MIFNAFAIVVAIIVVVIVWPLFTLFPTLQESRWGEVVMFSIMTVVGAVTDLVGLKGRVFFIPIWVWGLLGLGAGLHKQWGWWGPALVAALLVLLIGAMILSSVVSERKEWAAAPGHLNALRENVARGVSDETWELLTKSFSAPTWGDCTPERCRHNLEVLALARKAMPENPGVLELRVFDALNLSYRSGMAHTGDGKITIPHRLCRAVQEIFSNKGSLPEREDRKSLLEDLSKPPEAATPS